MLQEFNPASIDLVEGKTEPPPLLTEADLIALMDKHGIGTDATHAEHIETVKQRNYIGIETHSQDWNAACSLYILTYPIFPGIQQNDKLVPGLLGIALCDGYDAMGFEMSKPHLRAELEADLTSICEGTKDPDAVLSHHVAKYKNVFTLATSQVDKIESSVSTYLNT